MIFVVLRLYLVHSLINSFGLNEREDMLEWLKNIKIVIYEKNFESIKDFDIKQLW